MQNPIFSGVVKELARSGKSFLVDPESVRLESEGIETTPIDAKIRGHLVDWKQCPPNGERFMFTRHKNGGEFKIRPVLATAKAPTTEATPRAAPQPVIPELAACIGDRTVESHSNRDAVGTSRDEVIRLSWHDVFGPVWRSIRGLFARGLKARATARS